MTFTLRIQLLVAAGLMAILSVQAPRAGAVGTETTAPRPAKETTAIGVAVDWAGLAQQPPASGRSVVSLVANPCEKPGLPRGVAVASSASTHGSGRGPKPRCGNGVCDGDAGETSTSCPGDCPTTPQPSRCGDGKCDTSAGENSVNCPADCPNTIPRPGCGDGICAWPLENVYTCQADCPCQTPLGGPIC